jgi:hypothetical protein
MCLGDTVTTLPTVDCNYPFISNQAPTLLQLARVPSTVERSVQKRFLAFWSVSSEDRVISLVKKNVHHLRNLFGSNFDVYLAHYDLNQSVWKQDNDWYSQEVSYSAQKKGYKFLLAQSLFKNFDLDQYQWIWLLDEDVDFAATDVVKMFQLADEAGGLISLPTFTQDGDKPHDRELCYPHQLPNSECIYRYTNLVEVIFPFIRPQVLRDVLYNCEHCLHRNTSWGLNSVWCSFAAHRSGTDPTKACVLIDATPVIHRNYRTLPAKYYRSKHGKMLHNTTFSERATWIKFEVQKFHPDEFVPAEDVRTLQCIKHPSSYELFNK